MGRDVLNTAAATEAVLSATPVAAAPTELRPAASLAGDSAGTAAIGRLGRIMAELKLEAIKPVLQQAIEAVRLDDWRGGGALAIQALEIDEQSGVAWWVLAICRDKAGDVRTAITCYETALKLLPDHAEIANDLGRLAYTLGMKEVAEKLFLHFLARHPGHPEGANNLACALRDQERFEEAVEHLRPVIYADPEKPLLWNTLGTVLNEQGEIEQSITFYDEALRLDPAFAKCRYNRANARLSTGDAVGALLDVEAALPGAVLESEISMMKLARASILLCAGRVGEGWDGYEERLAPTFGDVTHFAIERPKWTPGAPATVPDAVARFAGFISYCARVEVNAKEGYVLHHVDVERSPNIVGTVRKRWFTFEGPNRLVLKIDAAELGTQQESRLVWERVQK